MARITPLLVVVLSLTAALPAYADPGTRFQVTVTSSAAPTPVTVVTSILGDNIRTESQAGGASSVVITTGGMTYMLNDDLMLAQAAPVRSPDLSGKEAKYLALADPTQVTPTKLLALFKELGARSLGTDKLGGKEVEAWALTVPPGVEFPLNNFRLYVVPDTSTPVRLDYQRDKTENVQVVFDSIEEGVELEPGLFEIAEDYKVVEYEW